MGENTQHWLIFLLVFSNWANFPSTSGFTLNTDDTAKRGRMFYLSTRRPIPRFCMEGGPMALNPGTATSHDRPNHWACSFLETIIGLSGSTWVLLAGGSLAKITQAIKIQNENTCSHHIHIFHGEAIKTSKLYQARSSRPQECIAEWKRKGYFQGEFSTNHYKLSICPPKKVFLKPFKLIYKGRLPL